MPFAPLDTLVCVIPADLGRLLDGLHTLAVQDGGTWVRGATYAHSLSTMYSSIEQVPGALETEVPEVVEHRLPGGKVAGRQRQGQAVGTALKTGARVWGGRCPRGVP